MHGRMLTKIKRNKEYNHFRKRASTHAEIIFQVLVLYFSMLSEMIERLQTKESHPLSDPNIKKPFIQSSLREVFKTHNYRRTRFVMFENRDIKAKNQWPCKSPVY